jgi:hypothetical protein
MGISDTNMSIGLNKLLKFIQAEHQQILDSLNMILCCQIMYYNYSTRLMV